MLCDLFLKKDNQLDLSLPEKYLVSSEKRGEFTGERLSERKPEIYRACVRLLGDGTPYLAIAKLLGISVNTIAAVKRKEQNSIESIKKEQAEKYRLAGALAGERAIELLADDERAKEIPLNQLAIASGIFTEKAELLSGGATSRVDWVQPAPAVDDFNAYLDGLRDSAEVIELEDENNGFSPAKEKTKAVDSESSDQDRAGESRPGGSQAGDYETPDLDHESEVTNG